MAIIDNAMEKLGKIIVIDGGDSTGKATQVDLLMRRLAGEGVSVATLDYPQYQNNVFGGLIRECLDGRRGDFMSLDPKIAATLYAADRFETKHVLQDWLKEGRIIILDRYVSANMLHQGAKIDNPIERQEFFDWLDKVEHGVFGIPRPDLTICLDVPSEKSKNLLDYMVKIGQKMADVAEKNREHQARVAQYAADVAENNDAWVRVMCMDGEDLRPRESIHEEIYELVKGVL